MTKSGVLKNVASYQNRTRERIYT